MTAECDTSEQKLSTLHPDWTLIKHAGYLSRRLDFKGFNEGLSIAALCGALAERENHHPDLAIGWGYCCIKFTTHTSGDVTNKDFDSARKLDQLLAILGYR